MATRLAEGGRRALAFVRAHPIKSAAFLPALVLAYVLVLIPFTPSIGDIRKARLEQPSTVLSSDGKELAVFKRANRDWVKLQDMSPHLVEALIATEDRRFYKHHGVDITRTAKAAVNTLTGDREGGSTITQQLARNLYPEDIGRAPTITRKIKEAITALKIEAIYSKQEILETYLNTVPFLYNAFGAEMAARTYFDKPASKLDVVESATLIGMLKGTSYYNPVLNPERSLERRNIVLAQMVRHGKLDQPKFEQLRNRPLALDFERQPEVTGPAPHMARHLRQWLVDWADRNDYDIYSDGLVVRTTIDSRLQAFANQAVKTQAQRLQGFADARRGALRGNAAMVQAFIRDTAQYKAARDAGQAPEEAMKRLQADADFMQELWKNKTMLTAGFLAMEPGTGYIRAWVGSRDFQEDQFDHVTQARRQPGSTFKPFVYGAAFESGIPPSEMLLDGPVEIRIDERTVWRPGDVDPPTGQMMTLRDGLAQSKNTITAQLMQRVGPSRVAQLARAMGVRESRLEQVPSLSLGTSPVTLKEMVSSYATIANSGGYVEPSLVMRVEDRHGTVLEEFHPAAAQQAISQDAAMTLVDVMRAVIDNGTAIRIRAQYGIKADVAGKTGTTQNDTDGWFIMMHPQMVAGAWVGFNDSRVTMLHEWGQGARSALPIVGDFFSAALKTRLVDANAQFAAERNKGMFQRMNDWIGSLFPTGEPTPPDVVLSQPAPLPNGAVPSTEPPPRAPDATIGGTETFPPPSSLPSGATASGSSSGVPSVLSLGLPQGGRSSSPGSSERAVVAPGIAAPPSPGAMGPGNPFGSAPGAPVANREREYPFAMPATPPAATRIEPATPPATTRIESSAPATGGMAPSPSPSGLSVLGSAREAAGTPAPTPRATPPASSDSGSQASPTSSGSSTSASGVSAASGSATSSGSTTAEPASGVPTQ